MVYQTTKVIRKTHDKREQCGEGIPSSASASRRADSCMALTGLSLEDARSHRFEKHLGWAPNLDARASSARMALA